jgi:predicted HTH transcriptional regulator
MDEQGLKLILEEGEGEEIEFKESLANLDKELVALANASGGRIFVGIFDSLLFQGTDKFTVLDRRDFNEDLMSNIDGP